MIKIGIVIDNMANKAGTERAVSSLCNGLLKFYPELYHITIISIFSNKEQSSFFDLNANIHLIHLEKKNDFKFWNKGFWYINLVKSIRKINKKHSFDVLIGTTYVHNILLPFIIKSTGTKTIGCEHEVYNYPSKPLQIIRRFIYPKLDAVIVLNKTEQNHFSFLNNTYIIPNSLPFESGKKSSLTEKNIIAVGRLAHQKGFDILIDVYEKVYQQAPDWKLIILGDGEDFEVLKDKIKDKKLEQQIHLCGAVKNISESYQKSSIFALSSRWESFGLVVIEAMNHGLPVVSFDCDGPKNIISDTTNGFLITKFDEQEFSEKLLLLINDENKRKRMGGEAIIASISYEEKNIMPLWNKQIQSVLKNQL